MASWPSPPRSSCVHAALQQLRTLNTPPPPPETYPRVSSLPRTSSSRLAAATPKEGPTPDTSILPSSSPLAAPYLATDTVLYLAYGSNLCAQTLLGQRGIRPLSATNVSVPTLRLTFDLPGIAYKEPCFANVAPRKIPKPPQLPPNLPSPPAIPQPPPGYSFPSPPRVQDAEPATTQLGDPTWNNGLIGVVYEVTPDDYAQIVATEGGGASYKDILVPCVAIPSRPPGIPEHPPLPELPKPFWAHTLYAPRIPTKPGDGDDDDGGGGDRSLGLDDDDGDDDDDDDGGDDGPIDRLKDWWRDLLLTPIRPDPEYAQPSARYLQLVMAGAAEHELPVAYQRWLRRLQPYTITSRLQAVGQALFMALVAPVMLLYFLLGRVLADEQGRVPVWFALAMETFFHLAWGVYDRGFKPVFGDGERTVDGDGDGDGDGGWGRAGQEEEKAGLLV